MYGYFLYNVNSVMVNIVNKKMKNGKVINAQQFSSSFLEVPPYTIRFQLILLYFQAYNYSKFLQMNIPSSVRRMLCLSNKILVLTGLSHFPFSSVIDHCYLTFLDNSSGTFISASEDKTGVLEFIEKKIARATMVPRSHGEVCCSKYFRQNDFLS